MSKKKKFIKPLDRENTQRCFSEKTADSGNVSVTAKTTNQKKLIIEINNNDIVICTGPAGSGKTYISTGLALQYLLSKNSGIEKIVFMRPAKEACEEKLGSLPGELSDKMLPWMAPIIDNMQEFVSPSTIKTLFWEKKIEIVPLAYARGRSLNKSFIICDESQNCSKNQFLMILTRIGQGSKMVLNGDLDQSDSHYDKNGLQDAIERLDGMNKCSIVNLQSEDIVRNSLITEILARYKTPVPEER